MEHTDCVVCGSKEARPIARGRDYIFRGTDQEMSAVQCSNCEHVYLDPRPTPDAIPVMYPDTYPSFSGAFEAKQNFLGMIKNQVLFLRFRSISRGLPSGARVLDIGCGDGQLLMAIRKQRPDLELHGLDWKFSAVTRQRLEENSVGLFEARLETAALPKDYFDLILMNQLIEHLWEPEAAMQNVLSTLRPGGTVSIETPDTDGYDRKWFYDGVWGGYYFPRHLNLFSGDGLRTILTRIGFQIQRRRNLVAPMIWSYSLMALAEVKFPRQRWLRTLFKPENPFVLAAFAGLDSLALAMGRATSNPRVDARRPIST